MKTVLFDMDGTITNPRESIESDMIEALCNLSRVAKVGIVTGSGLNYIKDQCRDLLINDTFKNLDSMLLMPCNGTKFVRYSKGYYNEIHSADMKLHLGKEKYNKIIRRLLQNQIKIQDLLYKEDIPLTGNFIDCRKSMINWCPIGRNATRMERNVWTNFDIENATRNSIIKTYFNDIIFKDVTVKFGGSTSFDIYPHGWDKTYALNHVKVESCYFIGDKCYGRGNDKEIFEKVNKEGIEAFSTNSLQQTITIIKNIINREKNEQRGN